MEFNVGDLIQTRKPHPCGCNEWEILRTGMDIRMKCTGCGHMVMLPRKSVEKSTKKIIKNNLQ